MLTDLAAESEKIIRYAAALARWYGAELLLIHACSSAASSASRQSTFSSAENGVELEQNPEERLKSLAQALGLQDLAPRVLILKTTISGLLAELEQFRPTCLFLPLMVAKGFESGWPAQLLRRSSGKCNGQCW